MTQPVGTSPRSLLTTLTALFTLCTGKANSEKQSSCQRLNGIQHGVLSNGFAIRGLHPNYSMGASKSHKVKGFTDDLIIISSSLNDHSKALQEISNCCQDLDLTLKPPKCVSFVFDGKKTDKATTFKVGCGMTRNMSSGPTKFLGQTQAVSATSTSCEAGKKFISSFQQELDNLDQTSVRGEYKLWIYKRYLAPSYHCVMAVDPIPESAIKKMKSAALKKIKRWLNLPRCFTTSALHHPNVIDIPSLSEFRTKAKLCFLSSISTSQDPLIQEILSILNDDNYTKS